MTFLTDLSVIWFIAIILAIIYLILNKLSN